MQNVQNAAEIQQRVINLVELYRTKVGKESQMAKEAKADDEFWLQETIDMMEEEGLDSGGLYGEGPHTEIWIKHLMVNEQLLGHFYSIVAGEDSDKEKLDQLLPDVYDKTIFTEEEEAFLADHFKEMVNYIILTPCDDSLKWVRRHDSKDAYTIPSEVLELIKSRVDIASGSRIYYRYTLFAQLANLFDGCSYYCDTTFYEWTRVALYANSIDSESVDIKTIPSSYDAVVTYLPKDFEKNEAKHLNEVYNNLHPGGKFVMLCSPTIFIDEAYTSFRNLLVEDRAIKEIIQLPQVMSSNASSDTYCLLIAEKGRKEDVTTMIDARFAFKKIERKNYSYAFDMDAFITMIKNHGYELGTGLRKSINIPTKDIREQIMTPQVYVIERPVEDEHPVPLSDICTFESTLIRDVQYDLPEDTPWITMSDLTPLYTGNIDMSGVRKADCPNNPPYVEGSKDYGFDKDGRFVDSIWRQMNTKKGHRVLDYRECTYLDGNSDLILYERSEKHGVRVAIVRATGKPYAVSSGILVFCPKGGFDAESLAALLRLPIVYRQLLAYQEYGFDHHLKDIIVPTDKRIVGDELYQMKREESVTNELGDKVLAMKADYINEVRMRKHDMRPHMKQLNSAKNLMQHYVDNLDTTDDVKQNLSRQLNRFRDALSHLSDLIDHLSDEEKFGEPERFSIMDYFEKLINESISNNCDVAFNIDTDAVEEYLKKKLYEWRDHIIASAKAKDQEFEKGEYPFPTHWTYANIAPLDFDRMVQNILENARKHGFTDQTRTDYRIWINLSVDEKRDMYIIDFMNNGTPMPIGMTKARYGLKGEKAGLTGGTGSGGYIVKSIITHYGGDYDVFCKDGITTIRIFLPIATI